MFSEQLGDFDNNEPIVEALVHDLKEVWENSASKNTTDDVADYNSDAQDGNSHVSATFEVKQQPVCSPTVPLLPKPLYTIQLHLLTLQITD